MEAFDIFICIWIGFALLGTGLTLVGIYDAMYVKPIAKDAANEFCKLDGLDQVKSFDRIGFLSKDPVAIRCEYAERYTDLGVRANSV